MATMASDVRPLKRLRTSEDVFETYDVFISHRGPDTKTGFVGFLYDGLKRAGLRPFLDCKSIDKGHDAWACIEHAIRTSPIVIVIFSENYAKSEWCLRELHAMLEICGVKVVPVFYKVEPWEVRYIEKGQLADGFAKLEQRHDATCMDGWRADLGRASKLNGWECKKVDKRLEKDIVNEIVGKVFEWANKPLPLDVGKHVIGVDVVAKEIIQRLDHRKGVLVLGLWGMGGIGKSTLARELYNRLRTRFDACSFIEDVTEKVFRSDIAKVQSCILKDLCTNESKEIECKAEGKVILEKRLCNKRILLVLDDVCENDEMEYLISHEMLCERSMCIMTSRNKRILEKAISFDVSNEVYVHDVQGLDKEDSKQVFTSYAFGGGVKMRQGLEELVSCISEACGGVPLVLKVCGALLKDEDDMDIWKDVLKKLECGSIMDEEKIFKCLRISYDSLQAQQKEMFLDIACALLGQRKDWAIRVWRSQGWSATLGVRCLVEKALVVVDGDGRFRMHDHLRDMGREIVKREIACEKVIRRFWEPEFMRFSKQSEVLETLVVDEASNDTTGSCSFDYSRLIELRIMRCKVNHMTTLSLPKNLRWFSCIQESLGERTTRFLSIPQNSKLVILDLQGFDSMTLWESIGNATKLEVLRVCSEIEGLPDSLGSLRLLESLDISLCRWLKVLPESFGNLGALRTLNLKWSCRIEVLPESFGRLSSLESLDISCSEGLWKLPDSFGHLGALRTLDLRRSGIEGLPESFGSLSSLESFNVSGCWLLTELPDSFGNLGALRTLFLGSSGINGLPESFGSLSSLESLDISWCEELRELQDSFGNLGALRTLNLESSRINSLPETFGSLCLLESLDISCCEGVRELPDSFVHLGALRTLNLRSSGIKGLPVSFGSLSSLESLDISFCEGLGELPDSFGHLGALRTLELWRSGIKDLPESFGSLSSLESLNISYCKGLEELPDSFGNLGALRTLKLKGSRIQGLPECFGSLSSLKSLDIS